MADLLALAPHRSTTAALPAGAARERGMDVTVLPRGGLSARLPAGTRAHYYGGPLFADSAAGGLGTAVLGAVLLEPADGWLDALPYSFTGRHIRCVPLSEARRAPGPLFVKPPTDKSFPAAVYADGSALSAPEGSPHDPLVQIGEVVTWLKEFRLHLLDGEIRTGSQYATWGRLDVAPLAGHADEHAIRAFAGRLADERADTLLLDTASKATPGRVHVSSSSVVGNVDFVFGRATAVIDRPQLDDARAARQETADWPAGWTPSAS